MGNVSQNNFYRNIWTILIECERIEVNYFQEFWPHYDKFETAFFKRKKTYSIYKRRRTGGKLSGAESKSNKSPAAIFIVITHLNY